MRTVTTASGSLRALVAATALLLTVAFTLPALQLRGDLLGQCGLDLRPLKPDNVLSLEMQVYWDEYYEKVPVGTDTDERQGTVFRIHVPASNAVSVGDADAGNEINPTGLSFGVDYHVRLYWSSKDSKAYYSYSIDGGANWSTPVENRYSGSHDPLAKLEAPRIEPVHRFAANPEKMRVRIWSQNAGIQTAFTISDI